jgi:ribosomal protein S18 acetylase RimI-like enzyme
MLVVRAMTETDIDAVATVQVRGWQAGYAGIVPDAVLAGLDPAVNAAHRRARPAIAGTHTLVAVEDGKVIGFTSFGPYRVQGPADEYDPAIGELYAIYVSPDRWGAGAGRALIDACRAALTADGYPEFRLWVLEANDRARRFYERAGMAPDGAREMYTPPNSTAELPEIRYAARL